MKQRLIIADIKSNNNHGKCTGHYFALADNYWKVFASEADVKIAGGPIYRQNFAESQLLPLPCDCIATDPKWKKVWSLVCNCRALSRQLKRNDVVIVQQSQPTMIILAVLLAYWSKARLYQIQYSEEPMRRFSYRLLRALAGWKYAGTICPEEKVGKAYRLPYVVVPDYLYTPDVKVCDVPYADKIYDFAVVGRVEYEKGIVEVCRALARTHYKAVIAGNPGSKALAQTLQDICKDAPNVELHLRYITDREYDAYLMNSRYCLLNYQGSYSEKSSGVVLDTLFRGIPILGHRCRALQQVEDEGVGVLCEDIEKFDFSILFDEHYYRQLCLAAGQFRHRNAAASEKLIRWIKNDSDKQWKKWKENT